MSLKDYEPRIAKSALHRKEEHVKQVFRDQVAEAAGLLEVVLSAIVLVALLLSVAPLLQLLPGLLTHGNSVEVREFLERALDIVIGIEFIKMLAKHSPWQRAGSAAVCHRPPHDRWPRGCRAEPCQRGGDCADLYYPQVLLRPFLRPQNARRGFSAGY